MSELTSNEKLPTNHTGSVLNSTPGLFSQFNRSLAIIPAAGLTMGVAETVFVPTRLGETILTCATIAGGGMAKTYYGMRSERLQRAVAIHQGTQAKYEQPIDVVEKKVRWYGFDKGMHTSQYDPITAVEEFGRVIDAIDPKSKTELYVSELILAKLSEEKAGPYSNIDVVENLKLHKRITDPVADTAVLKLDIQTAKKLHADLQELVCDSDVTSMALDMLATVDPTHRAVLARQCGEGLRRVKSEIRTAIEDRYTEVGQVDRMNGSRQTHHAILQGTHVRHLYTRTDKQPVEARLAESVNGNQTLKQLLAATQKSLANGDFVKIADVENLVWSALQTKDDLHQSDLGLVQAATKPTHGSLQSRVLQHPPQIFPWLRKYGANDTTGSEISYQNPARKRLAKGLAALMLTGVLAPPAILLGSDVIEHVGSDVRIIHHKEFDSTDVKDTVGDTGNQGETALWQLRASGGVSTNGYWSESVQNQVNITDSQTADGNTPPYKNAALQFNHVYLEPTLSDRVTMTGMSSIPKGTPGIDVTGTVKFSEATPIYASTANQGGAIGPSDIAFSVPVREGMQIAGLSMLFKNLSPSDARDLRGSDLDLKAVTGSDGTTAVEVKNDSSLYGKSAELEYFIEPVSSSENNLLPRANSVAESNLVKSALQAEMPEFISHVQAQAMYDKLPNAPKADIALLSAQQLAVAIRNAHTYSLNPYKDSHVKATLNLDPGHSSQGSASQFFNQVGNTAAAMRYAECNTAAGQEFLMTRGRTAANGYINPVLGFLESNSNSTKLTASDAHTWLTDQAADTIDPTSNGPIRLSLKQKAEIYSEVLGVGIGFSALSVAFEVALMPGAYRRKQQYLFPTSDEEQAKRHEQVSIINAILYGQGDTINVANSSIEAGRNPLTKRYASLQRRNIRLRDVGTLVVSRNLYHQFPAGHNWQQIRKLVKKLS